MPCPKCKGLYGFTHEASGTCANCGGVSSLTSWGRPPLTWVRAHSEGTHGFRKKEQQTLGTSGATHESEHAIGYDVLGRGVKRNRSALAREIENRAPAYQEHKPDHRAHIGTGNHNDYRGTGDSSSNYRKRQRTTLEQGRPGDAVQLNQLEYAYQPGFQSDTPGRRVADQSFQTMADNLEELPYWDADNTCLQRARVDAVQRVEMNLARRIARTGRYPSRAEELAEMQRLGIFSYADKTLDACSPQPKFHPDIHGIPQDGDCLFHAIRNRLQFQSHGNLRDMSADTLRAQAVGFLRYDTDFQAYGFEVAAYLANMAQPGTWGGGPEIMALAQVYGVSIVVIAPTYSITFNEQSSARTIVIHYDDVGHYSIGPT